MAAVWERGTRTAGNDAGDRVDVDAAGDCLIRILSPKFRYADPAPDHGFIGHGMQIVVPIEEE